MTQKRRLSEATAAGGHRKNKRPQHSPQPPLQSRDRADDVLSSDQPMQSQQATSSENAETSRVLTRSRKSPNEKRKSSDVLICESNDVLHSQAKGRRALQDVTNLPERSRVAKKSVQKRREEKEEAEEEVEEAEIKEEKVDDEDIKEEEVDEEDIKEEEVDEPDIKEEEVDEDYFKYEDFEYDEADELGDDADLEDEDVEILEINGTLVYVQPTTDGAIDLEDEDEYVQEETADEELRATCSYDDAAEIDGDPIFIEVLRGLLTLLQGNARRSDDGASAAIMTRSFKHILGRVNLDILMGYYLPAIPRNVQELIGRDYWTLSDLLVLTDVTPALNNPGVYMDFATGAHNSIGCEAYVGYSVNIKTRIHHHKRQIAAPGIASEQMLYYRHVRQFGLKSNYKVMAVFSDDVDATYVQILETCFMVLFNTFTPRGNRASSWGQPAAAPAAQAMREQLGLFPTTWKGMNVVWSLSQPFPRSSIRHSESPCLHCGRMTRPSYKKPDGERVKTRRVSHAEDPLLGFYCRSCDSFRRKHNGSYPSPDDLIAMKACPELREMRGKGEPIECSNCGQIEQPGCHPRYLFKWTSRAYMVLCNLCLRYWRRAGDLRPSTVSIDRRTAGDVRPSALSNGTNAQCLEMRKKGETIECGNCGTIEAPGTRIGSRHQWVKSASMIMCNPCTQYWNKVGQLRRVDKGRTQFLEMRRRGEAIKCGECGTIEEPGCRQGSRHQWVKSASMILCNRCRHALLRGSL